MASRPSARRFLAALLAAVLAGGASRIVLGDCGPFTDVSAFCNAVLEIYYLGITAGTSPTTFAPDSTVTRSQMALFLSRNFDQTMARASRRAALNQWWTQTPFYDQGLGLTNLFTGPLTCRSDGADIWVSTVNAARGSVDRVRASDGARLGEWTFADNSGAWGVLVAMGKVFAVDRLSPGSLYMIDPRSTPGPVLPVTSSLGNGAIGIAFDGKRIWTANTGGNVSIVTPGTWAVTTVNVTTGSSSPIGILYDGANIWVTDGNDDSILKLDSNGNVLKRVKVGFGPQFAVFDGRNIWVPNSLSDSLTVVRASDGAVLKTFSAANGNQNGLSNPLEAAFDGERILVANEGNDGVSLFKASDLSPIGNFATPGGSEPFGVCSDGINFWVTFYSSVNIGRY